MKTQIGISETNRQSVAQTLSNKLADEKVLCVKAKNAHLNIEEAGFCDKHDFYKTNLQQLDELIGNIAERMSS